jgi:hypothetical protein
LREAAPPLRPDPVAKEGAAAEVTNEQVMGHCQLEPGPASSFGEVVVIE